MPPQSNPLPPPPPAGTPSPAALPPLPIPSEPGLPAPTQPQAAAPPPVPAKPVDVPAKESLPAAADDGDLIEKEWVVKAKQLIRATAQDPYQQSKQFSRLKADYMQKRYGKDLKMED